MNDEMTEEGSDIASTSVIAIARPISGSCNSDMDIQLMLAYPELSVKIVYVLGVIEYNFENNDTLYLSISESGIKSTQSKTN